MLCSSLRLPLALNPRGSSPFSIHLPPERFSFLVNLKFCSPAPSFSPAEYSPPASVAPARGGGQGGVWPPTLSRRLWGPCLLWALYVVSSFTGWSLTSPSAPDLQTLVRRASPPASQRLQTSKMGAWSFSPRHAPQLQISVLRPAHVLLESALTPHRPPTRPLPPHYSH